MNTKSRVTFLIVIAQFLGTTLWFVGNITIPQIPLPRLADTVAIGNALAAVQFGFITGTLIFAFLALADRFSPSRLFFLSALLGALVNLILLLPSINMNIILISRFFTGFFLAGIYPVGMKIASDYYEKGLGKVLGYLVGALVLGTALPHLLNSLGVAFNYKSITVLTSVLALIGGILIGFGVPNGPYRSAQKKMQLWAIPRLFKVKSFRKAAMGYFGHMWELYAFWGFIPVFLSHYSYASDSVVNVPFWSFCIIAIGSLSCAFGGHLSLKLGSKTVARISLSISGICCLISPLLFKTPFYIFIPFLLIWGAAVVSDSPQFSNLVAQNALAEYRGTALTIVNCIGFALTILSIQILSQWALQVDPQYLFIILAVGPLLGGISILSKNHNKS